MIAKYSGTGFCLKGPNGLPMDGKSLRNASRSDAERLIPSPYQVAAGAGELFLAPEDGEKVTVHWVMAFHAKDKIVGAEDFISSPTWAKYLLGGGKRLVPWFGDARSIRVEHPWRTVSIKLAPEWEFHERGAVLLAVSSKNGRMPVPSKSNSIDGTRMFRGEGAFLLLHNPEIFKDPEHVGERETLETGLRDVLAWTNPPGTRPETDGTSILFGPGCVVYRRKEKRT